MSTKPRKERPVQPKCQDCHHPKSFHGGGTSECRALGCTCPSWEPEAVVAVAGA